VKTYVAQETSAATIHQVLPRTNTTHADTVHPYVEVGIQEDILPHELHHEAAYPDHTYLTTTRQNGADAEPDVA